MSLQRIFRLRRGDRPSHPISLALAAELDIVRTVEATLKEKPWQVSPAELLESGANRWQFYRSV